MRDVTLLWALRSPCNLGCRYCYFGTIDEHRITPHTDTGQLSHLSRADLNLADITGFLATIEHSAVERVFLAGGEPLIWPSVMNVIATLVEAGVQVVVCTNGIPLKRPEISAQLVDLGVHAVSVSLDSSDPTYNDTYRPARNGIHGWADVVAGIRQLQGARAWRTGPRIGIYSVISHRNLEAVASMGSFAAELGVDYFVPQPMSLAPDHPLQEELGLRESDVPQLAETIARLYAAGLPLDLPDPTYPRQLVDSIAATHTRVSGCFGGHTLFFVEPDGSVWDCPSSYKIAATAPSLHRSIHNQNATTMFGPDRATSAHDCTLASRDCVNMWPLMGFGQLSPAPVSGGQG